LTQTRATCGQDGISCFTNTGDNKDDETVLEHQHQCYCGNSDSIGPNVEQGSQQPFVWSPHNWIHPSVTVLIGRLRPRSLIRKTLEQALGEIAVVVCGPRGLVDDVRRSVVAHSDERAVHKGTGAQEIIYAY